jgi:hypothetical protein
MDELIDGMIEGAKKEIHNACDLLDRAGPRIAAAECILTEITRRAYPSGRGVHDHIASILNLQHLATDLQRVAVAAGAPFNDASVTRAVAATNRGEGGHAAFVASAWCDRLDHARAQLARAGAHDASDASSEGRIA